MFDVKDKTVLVTGANRGIGKAILEAAVAKGASKVYAAVRKIDSAADLVAEHGDTVVPIQIDLDEPSTIADAAKTATDVDVVVNNAGVMKIASVISDDVVETLQQEINVNVYGLLRMAKAFAPALKANGGGALVQLNSVASIKSFPDFATYAASKAASYSLTQALRASLGEQDTQVVSVHPGPIQTDMGSSAGFDDIAEPPSLVANAIFDAIASGAFHVWPDTMAKQIGGAYKGFADAVVDADMDESLS